MASEKQSEIAFLMLKQWQTQINILSKERCGELLKAIYQYQCFGEDFMTSDEVLQMLWTTIKQTFDYNNKKYEERCRQNSLNAKQRYATASDRMQSQAKDADIDKEIVKENDIDIDKDIEADTDKRKYTAATKEAFRRKYDFSGYSDNELTELYPFDKETGLTIAEYDLLYKLVYEEPLERYLLKIKDYNSNDNFRTIIQWAKKDNNYCGGNYEKANTFEGYTKKVS